MESKNTLIPKLVFMVVALLLSVIPASYIQSLIQERQATQESAQMEVTDKWGSSQLVSGPILVVPRNNSKETALFFPEDLNITGSVQTEMRSRGIYDIPVYETQVTLSGHFSRPDLNAAQLNEENMIWDQAYFALGLNDPQSLEKEVEFKWNGSNLSLNTEQKMDFGDALIHRISGVQDMGTVPFEIKLSFKGSSELSFTPVAKQTTASFSSNWTSPSFMGDYLPENYEITDEGFTANWDIFKFNQSTDETIGNQNFGMSFYVPSDAYQMTMRSAKYMVLFVFLTFFVFFFIEVINKQKLHPVQYLLVGFALMIFYLLLLSLGEHIGFGLAYALAGLGIVGVITLYTHSILNSKKLSNVVCAFLSVIYLALYIILQLSDYALLIGSLLLFAALCTAMYTTRKIDWYNLHE